MITAFQSGTDTVLYFHVGYRYKLLALHCCLIDWQSHSTLLHVFLKQILPGNLFFLCLLDFSAVNKVWRWIKSRWRLGIMEHGGISGSRCTTQMHSTHGRTKAPMGACYKWRQRNWCSTLLCWLICLVVTVTPKRLSAHRHNRYEITIMALCVINRNCKPELLEAVFVGHRASA